jgi:hypothetical protein
LQQFLTQTQINEAGKEFKGFNPAGSVDVSGHKREGYKEGELRGAISITVPVL